MSGINKDVTLAEALLFLLMVVPWIMGVVLAKGFWQTAFSLFPPYAWYLTAEWFMQGLPAI